jgi:hypothetical protein
MFFMTKESQIGMPRVPFGCLTLNDRTAFALLRFWASQKITALMAE